MITILHSFCVRILLKEPLTVISLGRVDFTSWSWYCLKWNQLPVFQAEFFLYAFMSAFLCVYQWVDTSWFHRSTMTKSSKKSTRGCAKIFAHRLQLFGYILRCSMGRTWIAIVSVVFSTSMLFSVIMLQGDILLVCKDMLHILAHVSLSLFHNGLPNMSVLTANFVSQMTHGWIFVSYLLTICMSLLETYFIRLLSVCSCGVPIIQKWEPRNMSQDKVFVTPSECATNAD